mmetsp:Transcript_2606/g.6249  ORF Transcript_2606/g.6249 Transcript_2606/m.6249 type:complete len:322 (+) Transcript_2606:807-1772(+)
MGRQTIDSDVVVLLFRIPLLPVGTILVVTTPGSSCSTSLGCQPGVGLRVLDQDGGEEIGEAVRAGRLGRGFPHQLQHEVGPQAQGGEVALGPSGPGGHRDAVDHVRRDVLVQLPLGGPLTELMLLSGLRRDGFHDRRVLGCEVEQRALLTALLADVGRHKDSLLLHLEIVLASGGATATATATAALLAGSCALLIALLVAFAALPPALVEVGELLAGSRIAELLEELVKDDHILVALEPRLEGHKRMVSLGDGQREAAGLGYIGGTSASQGSHVAGALGSSSQTSTSTIGAETAVRCIFKATGRCEARGALCGARDVVRHA